jgi:hypothetical protein
MELDSGHRKLTLGPLLAERRWRDAVGECTVLEKEHFCSLEAWKAGVYSLSCVSPASTAKSKDVFHASHEAAQELADSSGEEEVCFLMAGRSNVAVYGSASCT